MSAAVKSRFLKIYQGILLKWPQLQGFAKFVRLLIHDLLNFDIFGKAGAMAFTSITSLVPVLAAVFSLFAIFSPLLGEDGSIISYARNFILQNLTTGAGESTIKYLEKFIAGTDITKVGVTGGFVSFILLISLLRQIEIIFNKIWEVEKERNILMRFIYFWTFLTLGLFLTSIVVSYMVKWNFGSFTAQTGRIIGPVILAQIVSWGLKIIFCFLLYKIVPNCFVSTREAFIGALVSGSLFHFAVYLYTYYVTDFASYKTLYGAFAAIPIFLMWLYVVWIILMLGALIGRRLRLGLVSDHLVESNLFGSGPTAGLQVGRFRSLLPVICLVATYLDFKKAKGKGILPLDLAHIMGLPDSWIEDSFELLLKLGYVVECVSIQNSKLGGGRRYMPAKPADAVLLKELEEKLTPTMEHLAAAWGKRPGMTEIREKIMTMVSRHSQTQATDSLASIL